MSKRSFFFRKSTLYWCSLCLLLLTTSLSGQTSLSSLRANIEHASRLESNRIFRGTGGVIDLSSHGSIGSVAISGSVTFKDPRGFVRVLLVGDDAKEYLVYESNSMFASGTTSFANAAEETQVVHVTGASLKVLVEGADLELDEIFVTKAAHNKNLRTGISASQLKEQQAQEKANLLNANLKAKGAKWVAGVTPISLMTYEEKKKLFRGSVPNLSGAEFYKGGIFVMPGSEASKEVKSLNGGPGNTSPFIDSFDWRNRHGQFWLTSVKDQGGCGSCWSFAATATTEQLVNLYYNRHLNLDLSEQDGLSCSGAGTCLGGWPDMTLDYIKNTGLVNESCFPYQAADLACSQKCATPSERIKIGDRQDYYNGYGEDTLKAMIIRGPVSGGVYSWSHALNLVGYKVIQAGDVVNSYGTVPQGDPLIGRTMWIFKNSWSVNWGDAGYMYMVTDITDIGWTHGIKGPVVSMNYSNSYIQCTDADGDGYYFWGLGAKPAHCPPCPAQPDGDDSNPNLGPVNYFGYCQPIGNRYTLTTTATNGTIQRSPNEASYVPNTNVTLTAVPNTGYRFLNWNGVTSDVQNPKTITMTANTTVSASFKAIPVAAVTSPQANAAITVGTNKVFTATAGFSAGTVTNVDFYLISGSSTVLFGSDNEAPYEYSYMLATLGDYQVKVVATGSNGETGTSELVSFRVVPVNTPPTVSITSPSNGVHYQTSDGFVVYAVASDNESPIDRVEFFVNNSFYYTDELYPEFTAYLYNLAPGTYEIKAVAYDEVGASTTSAPITVYIDAPSCILDQPVPSTSNWILRNDWNDQNNGASLANETGRLKITQRAWGQEMFWVLSTTTFNIVQGKTYKIDIDYYNAQNVPATSLALGFYNAINSSNSGPVLTQPTASVSGPFTVNAFNTRSVYLTATSTQTVKLAFRINWGVQPNAQIVNYIRNVKVCESSSSSAASGSATLSVVNESTALMISPNPATEQITVQLAGSSISEIEVLNASGAKVLTKTFNETSTAELNVQELQSGLYILMVRNSNGVQKKVFIKQ